MPYRSTVDKQFSNETNAILERFSKIKIEDYSVENNLGLLASEYTKSDQIMYKEGLKDNITFEDILSYGTVSTVMQTQFAEMKSLSKDKQKEYLEDLIKSGNVQYEGTTERWISLGLDVIPIVGDLKGIVECLVGQDLITGRELSTLERGLSLASAIPLIGDGSNFIKAGVKVGYKGVIKSFGRELLVNSTFMGVGITCNAVGVPPYVALGMYQVGRVGYKYGGKSAARIKGVTSGSYLDTIRTTDSDRYKSIMRNLQDVTKDKSIYASSIGAGEFQKIIKSNENLRVIVDNVNKLGLSELDVKKLENILMSGSKEDVKILSDVILKSAGDGKRVSDFLNGKVSIIGVSNAEKLEIVIKDGERYIDGKPIKISQGQQDKHIPGTNNYNQAVNAGQQKSILTGDANKLLDEFAGTGTKVSEYKERVDFGQVIGKFYDIKTGLYEETTMGMITYGKNGAHIIPSNPNVY